MTVNTSPTNSRVKEPPVNKEVITTSGERYIVKLHKNDAFYEDRNFIEGKPLYKKDGYYYFCEKSDRDAALNAGLYNEFLFLGDSVVTEVRVNDLTTSQEKKLLEDVLCCLIDARFKLGKTVKFTELAKMIDATINQADREIIGAEDRRNERT